MAKKTPATPHAVPQIANAKPAAKDKTANRLGPTNLREESVTDAFETAMRRPKREKGFFVSFDYSSDALRESGRFFREEHRIIIPLAVREILDEEIARKLA